MVGGSGSSYVGLHCFIGADLGFNHFIIFNMESITKNGVSTTTEKGQEKYVKCVLGAFRGTEYFQYDYHHTDGELFSTVAQSLKECRRRRDE